MIASGGARTSRDHLKGLRQDRAPSLAERAGWQLAQDQLGEPERWVRVQGVNLGSLDREQERLALFPLKVEARG